METMNNDDFFLIKCTKFKFFINNLCNTITQALAVVGAVIAMEWVPEESRFICEVLGLLFWTTGVVLVTPIAYLMRDNTWRELQIALTLCSSYSLIQYWYATKSPSFYLC